MIKKIIAFIKTLIIIIIIGVLLVFFLTNADVRISIKNDSNQTLEIITIKTNNELFKIKDLAPKSQKNIVYTSKYENNSILIKYKNENVELHPYIEINDSMIIDITIYNNNKINIKTKKLLFNLDMVGAWKNYWYKLL